MTESAETSNVKRLILLLALTATTIAILWYGFTQGSKPEATMPNGARLLWLVAILLAAATAAVSLAPVVGDRAGWWARAIRLVDRIPPIWFLLATACVTSFVIAQVANTQPAPSNYWPLFALWLIALGAVVISCVSGVRWSDLHPVSLKERLWPYRWELAIVAGLTAIAATLRVVEPDDHTIAIRARRSGDGPRIASCRRGSDEEHVHVGATGTPDDAVLH